MLYCKAHTKEGKEGLHPGPGELSVPHIDQGLVCLQSSWVRVFLHPLWGSPPRPIRGWAVELRKVQEPQPVLDLCCVLSVGGDHGAPGHSRDPMVFKGN